MNYSVLSDEEQYIADQVFILGAFRDRSQSREGLGFKLKLHEQDPDAPLSPFYLNLRTSTNPNPGPLTSAFVDYLGRQLFSLALKRGLLDSSPYLAGIPHSGVPFAEAFSYAPMRNGMPIYPRITLVKKHVTGGVRRVSSISHFPPNLELGSPVLLIDDVITTAMSCIESVNVLNWAKLTVSGILVVIDLEQGGVEKLIDRGYSVYSIFKLSKLVRYYASTKLISPDHCAEILDYLVFRIR